MLCVPPPDSTDEERKASVDRFYEQKQYNEAKELCFRCPAHVECLIQNIHEPFGVWGGLNESERRQLVRILKAEGTL